MEVMVYAGGFDCCAEYVREWVAAGRTPDAMYGSLEEVSERVYEDVDLCPDDTVWIVTPDGQVELCEDW